MSRSRSLRSVFVVFALVLSLLLPTAMQAQSNPDTPVDQQALKLDNEALANDVAEVMQLRSSLSADQISQMQAIVDSHKAELQDISDRLSELMAEAPTVGTPASNKELFLPFVQGFEGAQAQSSQDSTQDALAALREDAMQASLISIDLAALQAKIDKEVTAVLTPAQSAVYLKFAAKIQGASQQASSNVTAAADMSASSTTDCQYGAIYGAYTAYYAYYSYVYGYYDFVYYGNIYSHAGFMAGIDAADQAETGLLYISGAYYDSAYGYGYDSNGWSDVAYNNFVRASSNSNYAEDYGYISYYYYGSSYGYYAYYYGYYASQYAYYAYYYSYYC